MWRLISFWHGCFSYPIEFDYLLEIGLGMQFFATQTWYYLFTEVDSWVQSFQGKMNNNSALG